MYLALFCSEFLNRSQARNVNGWLTDGSGIQLLFGAFTAHFEQVIAQNFRGTVKELFGGGNLCGDFLSHAHSLCALSREEESYFGLVVVKFGISSGLQQQRGRGNSKK